MIKWTKSIFVISILLVAMVLFGLQINRISTDIEVIKIKQVELTKENEDLKKQIASSLIENQKITEKQGVLEIQNKEIISRMNSSFQEVWNSVWSLESILYRLKANQIVRGYLIKGHPTSNKIDINMIEWITDQKRMDELNIIDDMPNGFHIYDASNEISTFDYDDNIRFWILDGSKGISVDEAEFWRHMDSLQTEGINPLIYVRVVDGIVAEIRENYIP